MKNMFNQLRFRVRRDRGSAIAGALAILLMLSMLSYAMISTTSRNVQASALSDDFIHAGQMADYAVQDALGALNAATAGRTVSAAPTTGSRTMPDGGKWSWKRTGETLVAKGTFRATTRAVEAKVGTINARGYKVKDRKVSYIMTMADALGHTVIGNNITVKAGQGATGNIVTGDIGVLSGTAKVLKADNTAASHSGTAMLYGAGTGIQSVSSTTRKMNAGVLLDEGFAGRNLALCTPNQHWKASDHGGRLNAGSLGSGNNSGCFASMDFDVPTTISGSGAYHAFVRGAVTIRANINGASLNLFTDGSVTFDVAGAPGSQLSVAKTFIHAPKGNCTAARHTTKTLVFTGSLACNKVDAAGKFSPSSEGPYLPRPDAALPASANQERTVWTLDEYQQPSGYRQ